MIELTAAEIARVLAGDLTGDGAVVATGEVRTDSRLVTHGDIFFALPGEVTDGHRFAAAAVDAGAALVVAERPVEVDAPVIVVRDGVLALSDLAREVVARVRALGRLEVLAVTGSNGKTTTKNMLRAILSEHGPTVAPEGSFNNEVGAPVSMLRVNADSRYLVVEMGADAVGDIAKLVSVVMPDVAIVTRVGLAHVGKFGDIETTARAKGELVRDLPPSAVAILNRDDHRVAAMAAQTRARVRWFGQSGRHDDWVADRIGVTIEGTRFDLRHGDDRRGVLLPILGEHHVMNALAALAAADAVGIPLERAVTALERMPGAERWRMELLDGPDGAVIINDAYNASPDSMAAALRTLAEVARGAGRRSIAVLGEMAELGDLADEEHDRIGRQVVRLNIERLVVVGRGARHIHLAAVQEGSWDGESVLIDEIDDAYDVVRDLLEPGDVVLVKSSKSAGLRHLGDRLAGVAG